MKTGFPNFSETRPSPLSLFQLFMFFLCDLGKNPLALSSCRFHNRMSLLPLGSNVWHSDVFCGLHFQSTICIGGCCLHFHSHSSRNLKLVKQYFLHWTWWSCCTVAWLFFWGEKKQNFRCSPISLEHWTSVGRVSGNWAEGSGTLP